ncbi:hypothetical protein B7494_g2918 [Chlorociboria aeruginascens]|nr:hypothetical protein B7494_g2918 [Chlorociboria aeruginascens]
MDLRSPPHLGTLPPMFYRVQHQDSFTIFENNVFESNGHYYMAYSHWLNRQKVNRHLDWKDRSVEPSPFVSVFDNEANALERAQHHLNRHHQRVLMAQISSQSLTPTSLEIEFKEKTVHLPVWTDKTDTVFVSTLDLRQYLQIDLATSDSSEWLAVDYIPGWRTTVIRHFN